MVYLFVVGEDAPGFLSGPLSRLSKYQGVEAGDCAGAALWEEGRPRNLLGGDRLLFGVERVDAFPIAGGHDVLVLDHFKFCFDFRNTRVK